MSADWEEAYRDRPVLITGGLGFIGSNLARRLVALGARVAIVDALVPGCGGNAYNVSDVADQVEIHCFDVADRDRMRPVIRGRSHIFNLAGQVSHIDSMTRPLDDLQINCGAHLALLELCRREIPHARIIFAGTRQQYGRPQRLPVDEEHPLHPTDVNGINKMAGEWYHRLYHEVYDLQTCSLRLTNTFGPRLLIRHPRQGFLSVFIRRALDHECIQVFGDGTQLRDYNYVDDVVDAFLMVGANPATAGEVYNLGSDEVLSVRQVAELIVEVAGGGSFEITPFPDDRKRIDIGSYYGSYEKIRREVGWKPTVTVAEGLRRTLAYYRSHREHYV